MRDARSWVAGVDEERLHRRVVDLEQPFAESRHVQLPGRSRPQVVTPEGSPVHAAEPAGVVTDAAPRIAPVAGDAGNAGNCPHRHPAAAMALNADPDSN